MKRLLVLTLMTLSAASAWAYDFSYTYQGKTLFYSITNSSQQRVQVDNPTNGNYYSYVSGDVVIPDSVEYNSIKYAVTYIGSSAFWGCSGLTSVIIPNSVTYIGNSAFSICRGLTSVIIPNSVTSIGNSAFSICSGLTSVTIPNSVTSIGNTAFAFCSSLTSVTIPNSVTSIGSYVFEGCSGLTSVTIPNSVTSIGSYAFSGCSGLTSVTIGNSVTSIGSYAFSGCSGLTSVTIPNSVTSIGDYVFYNCSGLTSVTIGNSVTNISGSAFRGCDELTSIVVESGNTHYDSRNNCNAIIQSGLNRLILGCRSTVIPNSVTVIADYAFSRCSGLATISIPDSVTIIGNCAFDSCCSLTSVIIGNSVTEINSLVFRGCSSLISVTIPNSVTSIGYAAFYGCSGLTSVNIPNSVTSIGESAFQYCSGLTSVTIPNSVTSIGNEAFMNCGLTSVYCEPTTPPTLGSSSFYTQVYVPCGSVSAYQSATNWSNHSSRIHGMPFDIDFTYTFLSSDDSMGTVNIGMLDCDSNITVTATANTGYQFNGWSDGGTGNPRTIHLSSDTMVTAVFDNIKYIVMGQPNNVACGIVVGGDTVYYGDSVTLTATPNYGYYFQQWQDNNTENPRTVVVTQNKIYTAYFLPNSYTVTVHSSDSSQGTVNGSGNSNYMSNRTVRAIPTTGYHFSHWSDGDSNAIRSIIVTQDTVLTAFFEINSYTLTVLPNVETLGTVTGSGTYTHGSQVTVTATPTQGNRFDRWNDNNLLASRSITMTSDLQLVAVFVPVDTVHVHDTTILHDTTYVDVPYAVHDTTYINVPYAVHDTTYVDVHDTTYIDVPYAVHDTTYINVPYPVHDTTIVVDTLTVTQYDTITNTVYDTIDNYIYDTTIVVDTLWLTEYDTVWLHDTTFIHDTVYITEEGIGDVETLNAKVYSSEGRIVVEGADGNQVTLYDMNGRILAIKQDHYTPLYFDVIASGTYMIKIGAYPAHRVVVIR